jgi:hypothetical protein
MRGWAGGWAGGRVGGGGGVEALWSGRSGGGGMSWVPPRRALRIQAGCPPRHRQQKLGSPPLPLLAARRVAPASATPRPAPTHKHTRLLALQPRGPDDALPVP